MKSSVSKTEIVYRKLRNEIIQGGYSPKERLVERELTEKFGVSKTPIREALNRLKQHGLVDGNFNQGMFVVRLSLQDAVDIYEIREALEGVAARKAAENVTPQLADKLKSFLKLAGEFAGRDLRDYFSLNEEFHNLLKDACGNPRLCEMLDLLYHQNRALLRSSFDFPHRDPEISFEEHKRIVAAILDKKPRMAEKMAREHLQKARIALLKPSAGKNKRNQEDVG